MSARDELADAVAGALHEDVHVCTRVWEAWSYGTMSADDFMPAAEDPDLLGEVADAILAAGYRKIFDGDCGLSNIQDPTDRESAEAWMRWANLVNTGGGEPNGIAAMKQMLTEFGYRKPRTITTVGELDALPAESVVRSDAGVIYEKYADEDGPAFDYWLIPGEQRAQAGTKVDLPATVLHEASA